MPLVCADSKFASDGPWTITQPGGCDTSSSFLVLGVISHNVHLCRIDLHVLQTLLRLIGW
jgi:hypothetical protein